MRWALTLDVKKKGAKKESEFYKKYGSGAGKIDQDEPQDSRPNKRRRGELGELDSAQERARLDDDLDAFLAEGDSDPPQVPSPPSKMRSDNMGSGGKSLLERTSDLRFHPTSLESRISSSGPRRGRHWGDEDADGSSGRRDPGHGVRDRPNRSHRSERPKVTQEDLDAELDAFLNSKE